ncbi:hypothetical protein TrVE_jg301 [Triparma verrucosa]|uniref:Uncharacterized protein n=1 Tax=Triparma verrucosa TaxID=1606542 RepID=A0A9W7DNQ1_9STRA|nr:hypothetical protein TrVE_jg301 [Triparma verrucosa]
MVPTTLQFTILPLPVPLPAHRTTTTTTTTTSLQSNNSKKQDKLKPSKTQPSTFHSSSNLPFHLSFRSTVPTLKKYSTLFSLLTSLNSPPYDVLSPKSVLIENILTLESNLYTKPDYGSWTIKATTILESDEFNESPLKFRRRIKSFRENVYNANINNKEDRRKNDDGDYIDVNYKEVELEEEERVRGRKRLKQSEEPLIEQFHLEDEKVNDEELGIDRPRRRRR